MAGILLSIREVHNAEAVSSKGSVWAKSSVVNLTNPEDVISASDLINSCM